MGNTSSKVKNEWMAENYDRVTIMLKKGEKETLKEAAKNAGESVSRFVINSVNARTGRDLLSILDDESKKKKRKQP